MTEKDFINHWIEAAEKRLPDFPSDFVEEIETEKFEMPRKPVVLGSELFGHYELLDLQGNPVIQSEDYNFVKFILYANRNKPSEVKKPVNAEDIKMIVKEYEIQLDMLIKEIKADLQRKLPTGDFLKISNQIFNSLNIQRY